MSSGLYADLVKRDLLPLRSWLRLPIPMHLHLHARSQGHYADRKLQWRPGKTG